jgi:hypothetical protein
MEPSAVLIENLTEALKQVNTYVALGSAAAVSALVIDLNRDDSSRSQPVTVPGGFIAMMPETAKRVLLGVYFTTGLMAYYAAESAVRISRLLQMNPDLLEAACTYPSIGTAPIGMRVGAVLLPIAFVLPILYRTWKRIRIVAPEEDVGGLIMMMGLSAVPYAALGISLVRLSCGQ